MRRDGGPSPSPEGLFLWKVLKAKGVEFEKHPRDRGQTHLGHRVSALLGWEMANKSKEGTRAECSEGSGSGREAVV